MTAYGDRSDDKVEIMTIMMLVFLSIMRSALSSPCAEEPMIGHLTKVPRYCLLLAIVDLCRSRYQGQGQVITSHNICGI